MDRKPIVRPQQLITLLWILLSSCIGISEKIGPSPITPSPMISEVMRRDAEAIAADLGISVEEAIWRLGFQDSIGALGTRLEKEEAETYAGLWFQQEPEFRVVASFTQGGKTTIKPYIQGTALEDLIDVRKAEFSLKELRSIEQNVSQITHELELPFSTGISYPQNQVEIYITDEILWESLLEEHNLQLPKGVEVIVQYEPLRGKLPFPLTPVPDVFMPQLKVRSSVFMEALLEGVLIVQDGCIRVSSVDESRSWLVIWQPDYFITDNHGKIEILDRDGQVVARVGKSIIISGGEFSTLWSDDQLREPVPAQCTGKYWLMGESVREK